MGLVQFSDDQIFKLTENPKNANDKSYVEEYDQIYSKELSISIGLKSSVISTMVLELSLLIGISLILSHQSCFHRGL